MRCRVLAISSKVHPETSFPAAGMSASSSAAVFGLVTLEDVEKKPGNLYEVSNTMFDLVQKDELKWALFERCKEELSLDRDDLDALEAAREKAWCETRKKYGL